MNIVITPEETLGSPASVLLVGDVDLASTYSFRTTARTLERRPNADLWLDLSGVTFLDCAGLGALEEWAAVVRVRGGTTTLTALSADVRRVLAMTWTSLRLPTD